MLNKHRLDSRKFQQMYNRRLFDYDNFIEMYYNKYLQECLEHLREGGDRSPRWNQRSVSQMNEEEIRDLLNNSQFIRERGGINNSNILDTTIMSTDYSCKICMFNKINTVCIPCGHRVICTKCLSK